MLRDDARYRRLKVRTFSPLHSSSHWLAADHLLVVDVTGLSERYRRFELRDILAACVVPARTRLWWNLVFGGLLLPLLGIGAVGLEEEMSTGFTDPGGTIALVVVGAIAASVLAAMTLNSLRGRGGSLRLTTAVQTVTLPGIARWDAAERLLAELAPVVRAAQYSIPSSFEPMAAGSEAAAPESSPLPEVSP